MNFDAVGLRCNTDKSSLGHGYLGAYEAALAGRDIRRILEIGVWQGGSLRMWAELFPAAHVVGVDNDPDCPGRTVGAPRVTVLTADATNRQAMGAVGVLFGPFDLVVDDGSHHHPDILTTLNGLWPFVVPGGLYVIEDLDYPAEATRLAVLTPFMARLRYEIGAATAATGAGPCLILIEKL